MAVLDFPFTCPNGHTFRANAKLRARCPTCTQLARRTGKEEGDSNGTVHPKLDTSSTGDIVPVDVKPHKPPSSPIARVLRQGRPRMPVKKPSKAPIVAPVKKAVSAPVKKLASARTSANGLVTRQRAARGHTPVVRKMPKKFARAKTTETGKARPFWEEVAERVKFW